MLGTFEVGGVWPLVTFQQGSKFYVQKPNGAVYPVHAERFSQANRVAKAMRDALYSEELYNGHSI